MPIHLDNAFETMSNYVIPHGTAVAMGMIVANRISLMRGWLKESIVNRIENVIWKIIHVDIQSIPMNMDVIMAAIRKDKKTNKYRSYSSINETRYELVGCT